MHAEEVKDSDYVRSVSENCVLFICLFAVLTVHYKFLTYLISLLEGTGAEQRKLLNFARCCRYVIGLLTPCARILAIVLRLVEAWSSVEKRMHSF